MDEFKLIPGRVYVFRSNGATYIARLITRDGDFFVVKDVVELVPFSDGKVALAPPTFGISDNSAFWLPAGSTVVSQVSLEILQKYEASLSRSQQGINYGQGSSLTY